MRPLRRMLDAARPAFEAGGRLGALKPLYTAIDNFCFAPATAAPAAPHVRDPLDVKRYMSMVIVALVPCVAASLYFFGLRVLALIVVSYAVGGTIEVLFAVVRKEEINEGFLVTGLLFPLILPPGLPLWMAAAGVAFGVVVGKEIFGGTGRNLFNPALVGRCFLAIAYPSATAGNWLVPGTGWLGRLTEYASAADVSAVTGATPLSMASRGEITPLADLWWGRTAGACAETSTAAIVAGAIVLVACGVANWRTIAASVGSFALLAAALHQAAPGEAPGPVWGLMAGGFLFGAVFMATDPVSGPVTNGAKWVYGAVIGATTVLIRQYSGYPEGATFAILLGNICAPVLDEVFIRARTRRLRHVA